MKAAFVLVVVGAFAAGFAGRRLDAGMSTDAVEALRRRVADMESARTADAAASRVEADAMVEAPADHRLEALESRVAAATKQATDDAAAATSADEEGDAELRRLRGLADPALLDELHRLVAERSDSQDDWTARHLRTLRACDALLARRIDAGRRSEVLRLKGVSYRTMREYDKAEATLREALSLVDRTSKEGVDAAIQLAFNPALQLDCRTAAQRFLDIAAQSDLPPNVRALSRNHAANYFAAAKDVDRARQNHRAVVDEFGASDDKVVRYWADQSRKALEQLDRGGDAR